jgi:DNA-directed RNA polymerase specialized sigma24 family protein
VNDNEYNRFFRIAAAYATRRAYSQISEDFAQEFCIKKFTGSKQTTEQMFIDFLRKEYGDTRSAGGRLRANARHRMVSLDKPLHEDSGESLHAIIASPGGESELIRSSWRDVVKLGGQQALISELYFDDEWKLKEIGDYLGVTESRISQIIKQISKKIIKYGLYIELISNYRDFKEESLLEIEWIKMG